MNKKHKAKWLKALRSGKYKQADSVLNDSQGGFCCLGVACHAVLGIKPNRQGNYVDESADADFDGIVFPTRDQLKKLGLKKSSARSLAGMNDDGRTFEQIAAVIERRY